MDEGERKGKRKRSERKEKTVITRRKECILGDGRRRKARKMMLVKSGKEVKRMIFMWMKRIRK